MKWRALFKRRSVIHKSVTLSDVWTELQPVSTGTQLNADELASVYANLLEFESRLTGDHQPLHTLRRELMDTLDRQVLNTEILNLPSELRTRLRQQNNAILQNDAEARKYLAANALRMTVLREYASRRFGDRAENDWFDVYEKAARLRQRNTRNYILRTLEGRQNPTDEARFQTMTLMDSEIRLRLLQVPAGTRFSGFHKTIEPVSAPEPDAPT